uniref:SGNH/GDSL hydrolase family protein n=1 Tax=Collinsella sp. BA40 TaxID=2560852 RepID=UPI00164F7F9A|nr:SGNH/GDSL hydrolase family protein [Collinsella sp. BA40]
MEENVVAGTGSACGACERMTAARRAAIELVGPGVSVLGDSISTLRGAVPEGWRVHYEGEVHVPGVESRGDTWWGKVIEHVGGRLVANSSYSGSVVEGFGFPAGISDARIGALVGAAGEKPDLVLVYMGINDYGWGGGRNQVMGGSLSASARREELEGPAMVERVVGPVSLERFEAAYMRMLEGVRRIAPEAQVWCLTLCPGHTEERRFACFKYAIRGVALAEYNDAIRRAAAVAGAHVADIASCGVCYDAVDACHPTAAGMQQIADMVIAQMEGVPAPAWAARAPHALPVCARPYCAGCPRDDADVRRWSIACAGPRAERNGRCGASPDAGDGVLRS